jgi:hypothetical protein
MRLAELGRVPFHVLIHKVGIAFLSGSNASILVHKMKRLHDPEVDITSHKKPNVQSSSIADSPNSDQIEDVPVSKQSIPRLQPSIDSVQLYKYFVLLIVLRFLIDYRSVSHLHGKPWREWTTTETEDAVRAFEGRTSVSFSPEDGSLEERWKASELYGEVMARCEDDPVFASKLDPFYVVVTFGAGNIAAAAATGWAAVLAASPVVANPANGSDFIFSFATREEGAVFLGYVIHAGFHGWLMTAQNVVFH